MNRHTVTNLEQCINHAHTRELFGGSQISSQNLPCLDRSILGFLYIQFQLSKDTANISSNSQQAVHGNIHGVGTFCYSILNAQVDCNRQVLKVTVCSRKTIAITSISPSGGISLKCLDISQHKSRQSFIREIRLNERRCNHLTQRIIICSNVTVTNNGTRQAAILTDCCRVLICAISTISLTTVNAIPAFCSQFIKCLRDEQGVGLCGIIDGRIFILALELHLSRNTCHIGVEDAKHLIHHIADFQYNLTILIGNGHTVSSIHQTNQDDLYIGIHRQDLINTASIVYQVACHSIGNHIANYTNICFQTIGSQINTLNLLHQISIDGFNDILHVIIFYQSQCIVQCDLLILVQRSAKYTKCIGYSMQHICTEGCITDTQSNDVCISNSFLVELLQSSIIINFSIAVGLILPTIGGLITTAQQIQQIFCAQSRQCQLGMVDIVALFGQVSLELQRVGTFAIHALAIQEINGSTIALLIAIEAIAVSHGVTN